MPDKLNILVIDDDLIDIEIIRRYLEDIHDLDVDIIPLTDTKKIHVKLAKTRIDLVLLDYLLAGETGLDVLQRIRQHSSCPVIMFTAHGDERIAVEIMRAGADDYLVKADLSPDLLGKSIRNTLHRANLIAEKKRMETALRDSLQELTAAKEMAEKANRAKSEFLLTMSHELRTPLTSILGFSELFCNREMGNLSKREIAGMEKILRNTRHLLKLINEILDFSKIESGHMEILIEAVDLKKVIKEALEITAALKKNKDIKIITKLPKVVPQIRTDEFKLKQVLINILENAVKFTEKGNITISLRVPQTMDKMLRINIADTGIGIPKNKLDLIFTKFQQAENGLTRQYSGTGMGLSISRSIMEILGGTIEVKSRRNKGSTFTIGLPYKPVQAKKVKKTK
jgi:signal transduction histidine kinase